MFRFLCHYFIGVRWGRVYGLGVLRSKGQTNCVHNVEW